MLPRHLRSSALVSTGIVSLATTLLWRAFDPAAAAVVVAIAAALSAILLLCGFAESPVVDRIAGGRRTAPHVFFRLTVAIAFALVTTIVVSVVVGMVRVAQR